MRRSYSLALVAAVVAAVALAVFGLLLPRWNTHQDEKWRAAGEKALAKVVAPASYAVYHDSGRNHLCSTSADLLCFVAPGDPTANVAALKAALATVSTGTVTSTCFVVKVEGSPDSCHVDVPVNGSRLRAELFSRHAGGGTSIKAWTWSGSMVELHLVDR
jgi:hypothetical protein